MWDPLWVLQQDNVWAVLGLLTLSAHNIASKFAALAGSLSLGLTVLTPVLLGFV